MIYVARQQALAPRELHSSYVHKSFAAANRYYDQSTRARRQRQLELSLLPISPAVMEALSRHFHRKCAFCERPLRYGSQRVIHHFRPQRNTLGQDGEAYRDHYWWLSFDWDNLFLACAECHKMKGSRFPIMGPRAEVLADSTSLKSEKPLLVNPCSDNPADHLRFERDGRVLGLTSEGNMTIGVLGLNRSSLLTNRREVLFQCRQVARRITTVLAFEDWVGKELLPREPFLALKRQFFSQWLLSELKLPPAKLRLFKAVLHRHGIRQAETKGKEPLPVLEAEEATPISTQEKKRANYAVLKVIERIEIKNFKGIASLRLEAPPANEKGESWLMFLGENATGKSSVLQSVALALMGQEACNRLKLDAREFIRRGTREGHVKVFLTNVKKPVTLRFNHEHRRFYITPEEPLVKILGYGATRLLPRIRHAPALFRKTTTIKSLFDPFSRLNHAQRWLLNRRALNDDGFNRVAVALKKLLMLSEEHELSRDQEQVWVKLHNQKINLSALSDGYQSIVVMAVNIIMGIFDQWKEIELAEGVVLVDELEVHLHPRWKMEIVSRLRQVFKKMMFLATTHDPLCLRGLNPGEIVVLRHDNNMILAQPVMESIAHLRADQLLTSPLFGLVATRDPALLQSPEIRMQEERYDRLFLKKRRTPQEEAEFQRLRAEIVQRTASGETPSDRFVEQAVRQALNYIEKTPAQLTTLPTPPPSAIRLALRSKFSELLK